MACANKWLATPAVPIGFRTLANFTGHSFFDFPKQPAKIQDLYSPSIRPSNVPLWRDGAIQHHPSGRFVHLGDASCGMWRRTRYGMCILVIAFVICNFGYVSNIPLRIRLWEQHATIVLFWGDLGVVMNGAVLKARPHWGLKPSSGEALSLERGKMLRYICFTLFFELGFHMRIWTGSSRVDQNKVWNNLDQFSQKSLMWACFQEPPCLWSNRPRDSMVHVYVSHSKLWHSSCSISQPVWESCQICSSARLPRLASGVVNSIGTSPFVSTV